MDFFANYRSKLLFSLLVFSLLLCHFKGKLLHLLGLYMLRYSSLVVIYTHSHMGIYCLLFSVSCRMFLVVLLCLSFDKGIRTLLTFCCLFVVFFLSPQCIYMFIGSNSCFFICLLILDIRLA